MFTTPDCLTSKPHPHCFLCGACLVHGYFYGELNEKAELYYYCEHCKKEKIELQKKEKEMK